MLEDLILEGTEDTPEVNLSASKGIFKISGRSYPENSLDFYAPIIQWLENYINSPNDSTNLIVEIDYINSGSVKQIFQILYLIEDVMETGNEAKITWGYKQGDELMMQKGLEFQKFLQVPIELNEL